ncbi:tRNA dihydrouridine(20/20a) synthase DusA [Amphritea sp. 1_MG-2023]|uniref:tRNA dihydrouridine(20/20a) synthase DusA n=1 Tax=Amphritea sp. 1_MG-2023 TaxID=3062670 RepID=UPI0026E1DB4A|nr:tRNA dihydrouridine(20/20a) synthase DusA [Amphritea sp. 1_MG-2023]MDO6563841.1 tRNA dihydrouridine(20/20a) synthase DusA [Amphritea sp. 1_MG-2023]
MTADNQTRPLKRTFSVAPMMEWTDRHCRYFHRLISQHAVLYTEMVTTGALIHGDQARFLRHNDAEHPLALQLGGSNAEELALCSRMAEDAGYNEVNLNVGCPSDRVQNNMIGACLMAHPELVAECLTAMQSRVAIPVTVKHRLGIDAMDSYEELHQFVATVSQSGCKTFIIHARKAILQGLSPKENRHIPPLNYEWVYRIKQAFPHLEILINGGIKTLDETRAHLQQVDGVMIGREAYHNPYMMAEVDTLYQPDAALPTRLQIIEQMYPYIEAELKQGCYLGHITRHLLGLFHAQPGGRQFRRYLSENAHKAGADVDVLKRAVEKVATL